MTNFNLKEQSFDNLLIMCIFKLKFTFFQNLFLYLYTHCKLANKKDSLGIERFIFFLTNYKFYCKKKNLHLKKFILEFFLQGKEFSLKKFELTEI